MTDVRFFTGSGHSEAVARACAGAMGEAALPMGEPLRENAVLLLVFPVYCERVPPPVAAYLKACGAERAAFDGQAVRYVPVSWLGKGQEELGDIHDGDILAIVTRKKGLDTSHLGFAVWKEGRLHLLNASSIHKKVVLEPMTLRQYMQKHPSQLGVRVVRVI